MNRVLTLLMMLALVIAPGTLVSAAVCRHHNAIEHARALSSTDAKVANAARSEDTAELLSKKGTLADASAGVFLADMLPAMEFLPPVQRAEPFRRWLLNENGLPGTSVRPLLQPPAA